MTSTSPQTNSPQANPSNPALDDASQSADGVSQASSQASSQLSVRQRWVYAAGAVGAVYLLFASIDVLGLGFQSLAGPQAEGLFGLAANPFLGLLLGILTTAMIQSSSIVTSMLIAAVAGGLPIAIAIPMVMGANIGTTLTNTLVSLGYVSEDDAFQRAFAAATIHDFFNLLSVAILFPLELTLHPLVRLSEWLIARMGDLPGGFTLPSPAGLVWPVRWGFGAIARYLPPPFDAVIFFSLSVAGLMLAVTGLAWLLKKLLVGKAETVLHWAIGRGSALGLATGAGITAVVQSSSMTTGLMVPLAGAGLVSLEEVYPFVLGANIGTCATAMLAAVGTGGVLAKLAFQLALVHLGFNLISVAIVYGIPFLRVRPLQASRWLSKLAAKHRWLAIIYVLGVFFGLPGGLVAVTLLI
ncbi:MAG: Na/Pi symporter [Cyanobacteria bacterium P01_D01_bin.44]